MKFKKTLACMLATVSVFTASASQTTVFTPSLSFAAIAADGEEDLNYWHGCKNITYVVDGSTLIISGSGKIKKWNITEDICNFIPTPEITSIVINEGITEIGDEVFKSFEYVDSSHISIPDSVIKIEYGAFCGKLYETVDSNGLAWAGNWVIQICAQGSVLTIPDNAVGIANDAVDKFYKERRNIEKVNIGKNVKHIGKCALYDCEKLSSIYIPDDSALESIREAAFKYTIATGKLKNGEDLKEAPLVFYVGSYVDEKSVGHGQNWAVQYNYKSDENNEDFLLEIPETINNRPVVGISDNLFRTENRNDNPEIRKVILPSNLKYIGQGAFSATTLNPIREVIMPDDIGITEIREEAFYCSSIEKLAIPSSVTRIGNSAFAKCESLVSIDFSPSLEEIGESAFMGTNSLKEIVIPEKVKEIGVNAFNRGADYFADSITVMNPDCNIHPTDSTGANNTLDAVYIYGFSGSTTEEYARKYLYSPNNSKRIFVPLDLGDINNDGVISIADAVTLQNYLLGKETFTDQSMFVRADLDGDGRVDVFDMVLMRQKLIEQN